MLYYNIIYSLKKYLFVYLATPGLRNGVWDLGSSLQHVESLLVACKLLVPPPGIRPSPNHWATREFPQLALFFLKLNLLALYFFLDFKGQKKYFSLFVSVQSLSRV